MLNQRLFDGADASWGRVRFAMIWLCECLEQGSIAAPFRLRWRLASFDAEGNRRNTVFWRIHRSPGQDGGHAGRMCRFVIQRAHPVVERQSRRLASRRCVHVELRISLAHTASILPQPRATILRRQPPSRSRIRHPGTPRSRSSSATYTAGIPCWPVDSVAGPRRPPKASRCPRHCALVLNGASASRGHASEGSISL